MSPSPCPAPLFPALSSGPEPRLFWRFLHRNRRWEHPPGPWIRPRSRPAPGRVWEQGTGPGPRWGPPQCVLDSPPVPPPLHHFCHEFGVPAGLGHCVPTEGLGACVISHGSSSHLSWMGGVEWRPLECPGLSLAGKGSPERRGQPDWVLGCPSSASPSVGAREVGGTNSWHMPTLPTPADFWEAPVALCQLGLSPPGWHQVLGCPGQWDDLPLVPSSAPCISLSIPGGGRCAGCSWRQRMSWAAPGPWWCCFWGALPAPLCTQPGVLAQGGDTHLGVWGAVSLGLPHPYGQISLCRS